ncbi:MAG: efflux RND transporter permease subunit [Panacagrimonas sp.]
MLFAATVAWSLRHRALVLIAAALLLLLGAFVAPRLHVDVLPDLTRPTINVQTEVPNLAPEDVETQVSVPLEAALAALPGVSRLRSVSAPGLSLVHIEFDWSVDVWRSRQLAAERIEVARPQLPATARPQMGAVSSLMGEILLVGLHGSDPFELREQASFRLRPALLALPGVSQVTVIGGSLRQYEVRPDPDRMRIFGLNLAQITQSLRGYGEDAGAGFAQTVDTEVPVRQIATPFRLDALREVAVGYVDRAPIRLEQVAEVGVGSRLKRGDAGVNGEPAVILAVQKQPGQDSLRLTTALEARLAELDARLPEGARRTVLFRQSDFIRASVSNVREALFHGALIVAVVLTLFLAGQRATLIALTAIPLSVVAAILVLHALGQSINTLTLGGIAIAVGELVDDAVVGIENVLRRLRLKPAPDTQTVQQATVEVRSGILYATLIIVLVFLPLFALGGIEGRLFVPLGLAYIAAILASLCVAVTVTPVLCQIAFVRGHGARAPAERGWLHALKRGYAGLLSRVLDHRPGLYACTLVLIAVAAVLATYLPRSFLPALNESTLTLTLILQPGIGLEASSRVGAAAERLLLEVPEVERVGRRSGRAEQDEHAEGVQYSELDVGLRDRQRPRAELIDDIRARLSVLPGRISIGQPISHRIDHLLSGVRAPLVVKVVGDDLEVLRRLAGIVQSTLAAVAGLGDVQVEASGDTAQVQIRIDPVRAGLQGLSPPRAAEQFQPLLTGLPLSTIVEAEKRFDLVLRLPEDRRGPQALRDWLIDSPAGPVPLSWIADVDVREGPNQIARENLRRRLVVSAWPADGSFDQAVATVMERLHAIALPPGYELHVEGQQAEGRAAAWRIAGLGMVSFVLMLLLLYARYRAFGLSMIVLGTVPLAFIGGVVALFLSGTPLSVASLIGFITLAGIAARNGILKLGRYLDLEQSDPGLSLRERVIAGSLDRLTPVLMTALIAAFALLPLILGGEAPGREILHPVALVIFGGLISTTLLDALLVPAMFVGHSQARARR